MIVPTKASSPKASAKETEKRVACVIGSYRSTSPTHTSTLPMIGGMSATW